MTEPRVGEPKTGVVKWFNSAKGFGFIVCDEREYFVHFRSILGSDTFKQLTDGQTVDFIVDKRAKGYCADRVRPVEANGNSL